MPAPSLNRQRAAPFRDDRHYFHRPTRFAAWKVRLTVLALLVTGSWLAARMIDHDHRYAVCTHGELISAHSRWADKCDVCHVPHESSGSQSTGLFDTHERWHSFRCESCHAGPADDPKNYSPHNDRAKKPHLVDDAEARDCSSCHHDHQGAGFAITRVADGDCVRCHKDLSPWHGSGPKITAFHKDHPEFRAVDAPPARGLKFNHALHLAAGLTEKQNAGNPSAVFKLGQIEPALREQYRRFAGGGSHEAALRLDCTACHEPAGGLYKPVVFDRHCQGCHAQTVSGLQSPAGVTSKAFTVPHGRPLVELDRLIRAEMLQQIDEQKGILRKVPLPPSDRFDSHSIPVPSDLGKESDSLAKLANGLLACGKCHEMSEDRVRPTGTPIAWLPAARFDHRAHRVMNCADCHTTWDEAKIARAGSPEPLNVPGIGNCRQCHSPPAVAKGISLGGVRHDCVDCHHYHGTRHP